MGLVKRGRQSIGSPKAIKRVRLRYRSPSKSPEKPPPPNEVDPPPTIITITDFELSLPNDNASAALDRGEEVPAEAAKALPTTEMLDDFTQVASDAIREEYEGRPFFFKTNKKGPFAFSPTADGPPDEADGHAEQALMKILNGARRRYKRYSQINKKARCYAVKSLDIEDAVRVSLPGYAGVAFQHEEMPSDYRLVRRTEEIRIYRDCRDRQYAIVIPHQAKRDKVLQEFAEEVKALEALVPGVSAAKNPRGDFRVVQYSVHCENGRKEPDTSARYKADQEAVDQFLGSEPVQFYQSYISACLQCHAPQIHMRQCITNRKLRKHGYPRPLFGAFPSFALNLRRAASIRHRDSKDGARRYCAIMPWGDWDSTKYGHLVLEEAKQVFELGPGDIIFFPSALFTHWNLGLKEGEERNSMALWASANLENWVDEGCVPRSKAGPRPPVLASEVLSAFAKSV